MAALPIFAGPSQGNTGVNPGGMSFDPTTGQLSAPQQPQMGTLGQLGAGMFGPSQSTSMGLPGGGMFGGGGMPYPMMQSVGGGMSGGMSSPMGGGGSNIFQGGLFAGGGATGVGSAGGWNDPTVQTPSSNVLAQAFQQGLTGQAAVDWATQHGAPGISYDASRGQFGLPDGAYVAPNPGNPGTFDLIKRSGGDGGGGGDASQQQGPSLPQLGGFGGSNLSFGSAPSFGPIRSYSDPTGGGLAAYAQQALGSAGQTPSFGGGGMSAAPSMAAPSYGGGGGLQAAAPSLMGPSYSGGGMQAAPMSATPSYGGGGFSGFTGMSTAPSGAGVTPMFQLQQGGGGAPGAL
jgi:hypothetical protein